MQTILELIDVRKTFKSKKSKDVEAVKSVSFCLQKGKCLGLVGESGCGKSTLSKIITGLEKADAGTILFEGKEKTCKKANSDIQMIFQDSLDSVNIYLTIYSIIAEPLENFFHMSKKERIIEVSRLLNLVGLKDEDMKKFPQQLSGGQLQRVCIARALAAKPKLLILDEPLSSLDVAIQAQILNLLNDLKQQFELSYILISHDLKAVYYLSDKIVIMYEGNIVEEIEPVEKLNEAIHPYTKKLLGAYDDIDFLK